jgi:NADPH:quinone reductase-like Zn-dependent oxidoreductase
MKAAVVNRFDAPPSYGEFEDPVAGDGEVLVEVSAAGFHRIVKGLASGSHYGSAGVLPMIPRCGWSGAPGRWYAGLLRKGERSVWHDG